MNAQPSVQIEAQLLQTVYKRLLLNTVLTAIAFPVFAIQMWPVFSNTVMSIWLGTFILNVISGLLLHLAFKRSEINRHWDQPTLRKWRGWLFFRLGIAGLSWGIGPALLMTSATGVQLALLVSIVLVASAVAVNTISEYLPGLIAFMLLSLAMPAGVIWLNDGSLMRLVAMVLIAGFGALLMVGKSAQGATRNRIDSETALKAALVEASNARTAAELASKAKSQFLATMSHELRTPLNAVMGGAQLLTIDQVGSAQQAQHIEAIQQSGLHLLSLIENILDLSHVETGKLTVCKGDFDLAECIESAVSIVKLSAQGKGLAVNFEINPQLPTWRNGDSQRLGQVILNLLGNAVKFTAKGEVKVLVEPFETKVRISVSDTGVGISPAALEFVFDPFRQVDQSSNRRYAGSGLGLAIVRMWVQAMGGTVSVQSTLGKGSCFVVELPLEVATSEKPSQMVNVIQSESVFSANAKWTKSRHVLVVEDDAINQAVVCGLLRSSGNRVSLAENGYRALELMNELTDVDVILMDWYMPDIDGLEVTRRLRAGEAGSLGKAVPIVALTANAFAQDRVQCLAAGMNDFLTKPIMLKDLDRTLEQWAPMPTKRPTPPLTPMVSAFDRVVFTKLAELADESDPNFAQEMKALFVTTLVETQAIIDRAGSDQDHTVLKRAMHSLKSSSASIGAMELSALAAKHEGLLREGLEPESTLALQFSEAVNRFHVASEAPILLAATQ
jgi:two-component system, sensor histidine kinase